VNQLLEFSLPFDRETPVEPIRGVALDAHLGDALMQITATAHDLVPTRAGIDPRKDGLRPNYRRQKSGKPRFAPGGAGYFEPLCHRINAAGWRSTETFPSEAHLPSTDLGQERCVGLLFFNAKMRNSYLEKANFFNAILFGADLEGANLADAYLPGAYLERANLGRANLQRADLRGADLQSADLRSANLEGVNLERANLRGANLKRTNLEGANLEGANLERAVLDRNTLAKMSPEKSSGKPGRRPSNGATKHR
jgi:hypothetical protein